MSHWLSSIVSHLDGVGETREKKLFSAVLLSIILYKLMQLTHRSAIIKLGGKEQFNLEQVITLLEMLVLSPNVEKKECTEYDFLLGMLSEQRLVHQSHYSVLCPLLFHSIAVFSIVIPNKLPYIIKLMGTPCVYFWSIVICIAQFV